MLRVSFHWLIGLSRPIFKNVRLVGSWDANGRYSNQWSSVPMQEFRAEDGCPAWRASVLLDDAQLGWTFHWGVTADGPQRTDVWAVPSEVADPNSSAQHRDFRLQRDAQLERYWLTYCRRLGANKFWREGAQNPALRFSLWAPNAEAVEAVIGEAKSGYIWSDGRGVQQSFALKRGDGEDIWYSDIANPALADFHQWDHRLYMFRVKKSSGTIAYRTDLFSRCQIGGGRANPEQSNGPAWNGTREDVNGTKSCSVIIDAERVTTLLDEGVFPETQWSSEAEFWSQEFDPLRPVPDRLDELVIYELHVGGLGLGHTDAQGKPRPGSFREAIAFLDHLLELGVNAVELMPMSEAEGWTWGYGTSHYFATEYSGGGRDQFKHFVRECHRRGMAVLLDVVYNHFTHEAERAEWMYDTDTHSKNVYYWYQGKESDWPTREGGYLDNGSTGFSPNFRNEFVRAMFISSAAMLLTEFHIDGFRVDLTQAMHRDNTVHANRAVCSEANLFGTKFLREWVRTLRLIKPSVILTAEDHTGWRAMTQPLETGGIGFDAVWWTEWYHQLIGDSQNNSGNARLLYMAGMGGNEPLAMSKLAEALEATPQRVIYHESHDQAGNAKYSQDGRDVFSARTIQVAVNGHLPGNRFWAEARCRFACGITMLTPAVPMFFMGEEVGAKEPYRYDDWLYHREDITTLARGSGAQLFRFYRDVIRLRRSYDAMISPNIEVVHVHDANRVVAFRRWLGDAEFLVLASLNNAAFNNGYRISSASLSDGAWLEVLNSDAEIYGGRGVCNGGTHNSVGGTFNPRLPANGIIVFQRV